MKIFFQIISTLLIVLAILIVIGGLATAQGAPQECVVMGAGCFVAILARIAQASAHDCK